MGNKGVKGVVAPGQKIPVHQVRDGQELPEDQHTVLAAGKPDGIMFAAKDMFRFMSKTPRHQRMVVHTGPCSTVQR